MNTIKKKYQECPQKMSVPTNSWKIIFAKSMKPPPIKLYNILEKMAHNKLMYTFYMYLAFIQTRMWNHCQINISDPLLILISLTSNYRLAYTISQKFFEQ